MLPGGLGMVVVHLHNLFGNTTFRQDCWKNLASKRWFDPPRETKC